MEFSYFDCKNNAAYEVDRLKKDHENIDVPYFTYAYILKNALNEEKSPRVDNNRQASHSRERE